LKIEYGYIGHPDIGSKLTPQVLPSFKDEGIKIKDVCCGIRNSMVLTGIYFKNIF